MAKCDICQTESSKLYWWSRYPSVYLCKSCWRNMGFHQPELIRISLARDLKSMRREGKVGRLRAIRLLQSLRGEGIPVRRRKNSKGGDV